MKLDEDDLKHKAAGYTHKTIVRVADAEGNDFELHIFSKGLLGDSAIKEESKDYPIQKGWTIIVL